ncbi:MAG: fibronectin type III domain-containing protein, partial [Alistipes sp.]|nr:fibronectin type III domain-containing protein [Alistipes sp.]
DTLEKTAAPTGYIVYTRKGDGGFDNGRSVSATTCTFEQEPGVIYSYRVTAVNDGGESFPSETLAACRMPNERGGLLIVNGFDRVSAPCSSRCDSLAGFYHSIDGGVPDRRDISFIGEQQIFDLSLARSDDDAYALGTSLTEYETDVIGGNTFDYPYLHGLSVCRAGYSFCSASVRAVERQEVTLSDYPAVDLILGKQRATTVGRGTREAEFRAFSPEMQQALRGLQQSGGNLFVSGSYAISDLCADEEGCRFAEEVLHTTLDCAQATRQGKVRIVASPASGFSRGEYRFHDRLGPDHYAVESPDALLPADDTATVVMRYAENGRTAGIAATGNGRTFVMSFPFEALTTQRERDRLMREALHFLMTE